MIDLREPRKIRTRFISGIAVLLLMASSFYGGIFFSRKSDIDDSLLNEETLFLGNVLGKYEEQARADASKDIDFQLLWDVWDALKERYVDAGELQDKELFYGALRGLVAAGQKPLYGI